MENLIEDDAFLEALYEFIEEDECLIDQDSTKKVTRNRPDKIDYWTTKWGQMLLDPNSRREHTKEGKLWTRRFRTNRDIVDLIVQKCNEGNVFWITEESKVRVPTEFKVLMSLRILARGSSMLNID